MGNIDESVMEEFRRVIRKNKEFECLECYVDVYIILTCIDNIRREISDFSVVKLMALINKMSLNCTKNFNEELQQLEDSQKKLELIYSFVYFARGVARGTLEACRATYPMHPVVDKSGTLLRCVASEPIESLARTLFCVAPFSSEFDDEAGALVDVCMSQFVSGVMCTALLDDRDEQVMRSIFCRVDDDDNDNDNDDSHPLPSSLEETFLVALESDCSAEFFDQVFAAVLSQTAVLSGYAFIELENEDDVCPFRSIWNQWKEFTERNDMSEFDMDEDDEF